MPDLSHSVPSWCLGELEITVGLHTCGFHIWGFGGLTILPTIFVCVWGGRQYLQHTEVSRLGVQLELQLQAYTTATATQGPSCICDLHCIWQQCPILNPLSKARDRTHIFMDTSWILHLLSHNGNSCTTYFIQGTWASPDFSIHGDPATNSPKDTRAWLCRIVYLFILSTFPTRVRFYLSHQFLHSKFSAHTAETT